MGAPGTSDGPWHAGHITDADHPCNCRSIVNEVYAGGIATIHLDNGIAMISQGGNDCPPLSEAIANSHQLAASGALYDACEKAASFFAGIPFQTEARECLEALDAALAQARGEVSVHTLEGGL